MPEYLAPGVYVEEIDTGSKPIEGVSTSTAGMVGVTERGPVNVPILVTSYGEYVRWFGERLRAQLYSNGNDRHCYLPHAVEGFFTNGGKRLYVVRILDSAQAAEATIRLFDRNAVAAAMTSLLQPFNVTPPANTIYVANGAGLALTVPPTWIQVGDGSGAEFRQIAATPARSDVALRLAPSFAHGSGLVVDRFPQATILALAPTDTPQLDNPANPGDTRITISGAGAVNPGTIIRIGSVANGDDEYVIANAAPAVAAPAAREVVLRTPVLLIHPGGPGNNVDILPAFPAPAAADQTPLAAGAAAGLGVILVANRANFVTAGDFVRINDGNQTEIRRIGQVSSMGLPSRAYGDYPAGSVVEVVNENVGAPRSLTRDVDANVRNIIEIDDRTGLSVGDVLRIGLAADPQREYVTIAALPNPQAAPNAGRVVLATPLQHTKAAPSEVRRLTPPINRSPVSPTALAQPALRNAHALVVSGGSGIAAPVLLRVRAGANQNFYHLLPANPVALNAAPLTLNAPLNLPHVLGEAVVARAPLLRVQALDQGDWGNRLRVAVRDSDPPLARSQIRGAPPDATHLRLSSPNGVEPGTILHRVDAGGAVLSTHKVVGIARQNDYLITLDPATPLPAAAAGGDAVRSHEFQIDVFLMRQPDPAVPTRSDSVLMTESFPHLSLDTRHSRYLHKVIGTTWSLAPGTTADDDGNPLRKSDHRSEGASWLIRVRDEETVPANQLTVRLGPTPLSDTLPSGATRPARLALNQGNDAIGAITAATYIGTPDIEPEQRTGLFALQNEEDVSIIACPGQTGAQLQGALISHCEEMRYRFAVLDGPRPPNDSLNDAQILRQNFDSKYAAFYHPWLVIPDPYPLNLAKIPDYPIPPSGHMLGIYARTDIERGVHKAPANEVVRGIIGLQRRLNKGEHDILNPYPVNINVIRDFRENSRGIRVYGGRVITSDPDWKYVNVRRLLIFIEASIDRGLQWVVFEPNAEPLWARVRRSITNFLNLVWRNGALEGTKPEEAFFVKCDRTTMTQTDIDSGRLICVIGVAPVKPAEFVIVRIGLWTAHAED